MAPPSTLPSIPSVIGQEAIKPLLAAEGAADSPVLKAKAPSPPSFNLDTATTRPSSVPQSESTIHAALSSR